MALESLFSHDWRDLLFHEDSSMPKCPGLGINYVVASAPTAVVGDLTIQQDLAHLGIAGVVWNCVCSLARFSRRPFSKLVLWLFTGTRAGGFLSAVS
jgi:hypothetical protein